MPMIWTHRASISAGRLPPPPGAADRADWIIVDADWPDLEDD
jgi:hypothetical protein